MKNHSMNIRVYYEDTDLGGVVYYANYLRFIERARSEWIREIGIDQIKMRDDEKIIGILAIASKEKEKFTAQQGVELLKFMGNVFERRISHWLN